jgi:hypothetical protein
MTRFGRTLGIASLLAVGGLGLLVPCASAQSAAGPEVLVNTSDTDWYQYLAQINCPTAEGCAVFWISVHRDSPRVSRAFGLVSALNPEGVPTLQKLLASDTVNGFKTVRTSSGWRLFWDHFAIGSPAQVWTGSFALGTFEPVSEVKILPYPGLSTGAIRAARELPGRFALLFDAVDEAGPQPSNGPFLTLLDHETLEVVTTLAVHDVAFGAQETEDLVVSNNDLTVIYEDYPGIPGFPPYPEFGNDVRRRRFTLDGEPLAPSELIGIHREGNQGVAAGAGTRAGRQIIVWIGTDGTSAGILAQRFDALGQKRGSEIRVSTATEGSQTQPFVATDDRGNFLVAWEWFDPDPFGDRWQIKARLFRANGTPVGPEITVNQHANNDQQAAQIAFMGGGQFLVGWQSASQVSNDSATDVYVRRVSASPGDEPCLISQGLLRCDLGRTGEEAEIEHAFGASPSGPAMLGDIDGDGRADPCEWHNQRFRCDTDHEGGVAEVKLFLQGTGLPLLGDVDGDGRAEPCLYSAGRFSCDTAHNGGKAETVLRFGTAAETPLLGDLDGDGDDDPCAFSLGKFRCDTKHDGGAAEVVILFGRAGDQPLLGDFDGDGDDDPCVYRSGSLLCDTAHDGGTAEQSLAFGNIGDRVILGNLDGL